MKITRTEQNVSMNRQNVVTFVLVPKPVMSYKLVENTGKSVEFVGPYKLSNFSTAAE